MSHDHPHPHPHPETPKSEKVVYDDVQKELIKVSNLLHKKGLKEREAVWNRKRVYYFRADKFHELVLENADEILTLLKDHAKFDKLEKIEDSMRLGDAMINQGLMKWFDRIPDDVKKFKYPKKLLEIRASMLDKGFYGFDIVKSQTKTTILAIGLAVSIIAIILFPLWPYSVKLGIFNVLFYFSASMIALVIIRLIVFLSLFVFGVDFWIFPNMFDDDLGIIESFIPILLVARRQDGWAMFAFRIFLVLMLALYAYGIYHDPQKRAEFWNESGVPSPVATVVDLFNDVFEWGKDKMIGNETSSLQVSGKGHKSLDDVFKMTEDAHVRAEFDTDTKSKTNDEKPKEEKREEKKKSILDDDEEDDSNGDANDENKDDL